MPRPRKNDASVVILPIVEQYAKRLGETLERFITKRIDRELEATRSRGGNGRRRRRKRPTVHCYYAGCKNIAAPRFGMFCAALHKGLSKAEKEKYRSRHLKQAAKAAQG